MMTLSENIDELAIKHNFPHDYKSILERGFNFFSCLEKETIITHQKHLDIIEDPQYYLLIGKYNLTGNSNSEYRFNSIVGYFSALDKYHYECIKRRDYKSMNDFYIMRFEREFQPNNTTQLKKFRRFIQN